jgi:hypothetical protein
MTDASETPLWDELKALLRALAAIFGDPASLRDDGAILRGDGLALRTWLRALESVARSLLLIAAARLPRPAPVPSRPGGTASRSRPIGPYPDDMPPAEPAGSERWADVAFRSLLPRRGPHGARARAEQTRFLFTRPLACRFEALIRVAEAPLPYARRLARRLHAQPTLAARLLSRQESRGGRPPPCRDLAEEALSHASIAARVFAPETG